VAPTLAFCLDEILSTTLLMGCHFSRVHTTNSFWTPVVDLG
jgi:hypothetical protein